MGAPKNFNGEQQADFGNGYVGLYMFAPEDYREYITGALMRPLVKGTTYEVSFYVSLAERSDFAVRTFGVLFTESSFSVETRKTLSAMHLSKVAQKGSRVLEIEVADFYRNQKDWVLVSTEFVAKGGEQFMTIGNFKDNKRTRKFSFRGTVTKGAYYYLDMVKVEVSKGSTLLAQKDGGMEKGNIELPMHTATPFKNVVFAFDAFYLTDMAKAEIKSVYEKMKTNAAWHIFIGGHTDNIGSRNYNQQLSEKRAQAVAHYLMDLGLETDRISWKGYGSTKPATERSEPNERKRNRRVEFMITPTINNQNNP
jgi:outer membrane protein OmpA-like peptidoglycan-associated protein